jgi:hypothetical protein
VAQLTRRAQDAGAEGPQTIVLLDQAELDRVPVQAREQLARAQVVCLQAAGAVALRSGEMG